jgi:hypothetical protein
MYQGTKWVLLKQKNGVKNLTLGHLSVAYLYNYKELRRAVSTVNSCNVLDTSFLLHRPALKGQSHETLWGLFAAEMKRTGTSGSYQFFSNTPPIYIS